MSTRVPLAQSRPKGRPCKSSADSPGAARRKQIREAQRAYRSRQQDLVSSLKERNSQLEDALNQMCHVADALQLVTQAGPSVPRPRLSEAVNLVEKQIRDQIRLALDANPSEKLRDSQIPTLKEHVGQLLIQDRTEDPNATRANLPSSHSQFWTSFFQTSHLLVPDTVRNPVDHSSELALTTIKNRPIQYATTLFTQRLFRACAENGYKYLMKDTISDQAMWPEFGLMLQSLPRSEIKAYFERVVRTVPCNPLEDSRFPFISLGGAGTHFQARYTREATSIQPLHRLQVANGIINVPCDEEWFDIHDVEGYLLHCGFQLKDTHSISSNNNNPRLFGLFEDDLSRTVSSSVSAQSPSSNQTDLEPSSLTINEDALIEALSHVCIDIGCAAAFRRHDVEALVLQNTQ